MIKKINKTSIVLGVLALMISGYSYTALAHMGASGIVKERMDLMGMLGKAQKSLGLMFSGKETYDVEKVKQAAKIIQGHAGENITKLFPEGSDGDTSEARAEIWENWEEFNRLSDEMGVFAKALYDNAGNEQKPAAKQNLTMGGSASMTGSSAMGGNVVKSLDQQIAALNELPPMASFQSLAKNCAACHTTFREKKSK